MNQSIYSAIPRRKRERKGVEIAAQKLEILGFGWLNPERRSQDGVAVKGDCRIPIQVKPVPLTRTIDQTCITNSSLENFEGLYVLWVEQQNKEIAFLYIPHEIFIPLVHKYGRLYKSAGKVRPHKNRWYLSVPRNLKGFERFVDDTIPDRYCLNRAKLIKDLTATQI